MARWSSLDTVVNLFHAGRYCALPRAIMRRALNDLIPGENNPTPKARLNLLDIIINGAMLHDVTFAAKHSKCDGYLVAKFQLRHLPEFICSGVGHGDLDNAESEFGYRG